MIRTVLAATNSANRISTAATIKPTIPASSVVDERRGAPDLHHVHARPGLEHLVLIVGARAPHLAVEAHLPPGLVVDDPLGDDRRAADERRRAGPQLRRHVDVTPGDRTDNGEAGRGEHREDGPR